MNRREIIQRVLDTRPDPRYLEIGVSEGATFLRIRRAEKIAVDPEFKISAIKRLFFSLINATNVQARYFEMDSDLFFERHSALLGGGLDAAFVDGLHTFDQAYRDIENCLEFLKDDGAVLVHDCDPPNAAAALVARSPAEAARVGHPVWNGVWTGDVFKAIVRLRATRDDLHVFVVDSDLGVGVVERGVPERPIELSPEAIAALTFDDLQDDRARLLNLKSVDDFKAWAAAR